MRILEGLQPERPLYYFEEISKIPRGSGNTKGISDYIAGFAKNHGLFYIQDENNNIIVKKEAHPGYEKSDAVILQGHLDMVCEKEDGYETDFLKNGIKLIRDGNILSAEGTTLGADDGVAVCFMLALLEDESLKAPALECVFSVDEEIGMLGSAALDMSPLKGKYMINIDEGNEDSMLAGCAGGVTASCHMPVEREKSDIPRYILKIGSLTGGHSGEMIDKQRANANTLMGRILYALMKHYDIRIASLTGGLKDNAIPRSCEAVIGARDSELDDVRKSVSELSEIIKKEYCKTDPDMVIELTSDNKLCKQDFMNAISAKKAVTALYNLPAGIQKMSEDISGLVETSLNMGILETNEDEVTYSFSVRSSKKSEKQELNLRMESLMECLGGTVTYSGDYPAWEYREGSRLQKIMSDVHKDLFNKDMQIGTIHAGVECGIFSDALDNLDCISIGPNMYDIHTPLERLELDSFKRCYESVVTCLERLK